MTQQDGLGAGPAGFRSGFCGFVGRPNAGKSTLANALVGDKIAITSDRPQTTRRAIRGILTRPDAQLVVVDLPGQRLNDVVRSELAEVDVIGFCVPADEKIGPGDRFIAAELSQMKAALFAIVTKTDAVSRARVAQQLVALSALGTFAEVVPVSAHADDQVGLLADLLVAHLPPGPQLYPSDVATDTDTETRIAELIREAALAGAREELPHSIAVTIEEMNPREGRPELLEIYATLHIERSSQKPIVLGAKGARLKEIGTVARVGLGGVLGRRVHLDLHVAVLAEWQRDPKKLDRLGF